jgi:hypothetical protein
MAQLFTNLQDALAQGVKVCMIMNTSGEETTTGVPIFTSGSTEQIISHATQVMSISASGTTLSN